MSKKPRDRNKDKTRTVTEFCPKCSTPVDAPVERAEVTLRCPVCFVTWTVSTHGAIPKGTVTSEKGGPGPTEIYTYTEGNRTFVAPWDGRDDGDTLHLHTATWSNGDPIDDAARMRIHNAFLASTSGPLVDTFFQPQRKLR